MPWVFFPYTAVEKNPPDFFLGNFPINPIGSLYGIFTYIYRKNQPNVAIYHTWILWEWHGTAVLICFGEVSIVTNQTWGWISGCS